MVNSVNPVMDLNEIPLAVDPKNIAYRKMILITVWLAISLYLVIFIIDLVLNIIYDLKPTESWEVPFAICLSIIRYLIGFTLILTFILLKKNKLDKLVTSILLIIAIVAIIALETTTAIADFGNVVNRDDPANVIMWLSIIDALTAVALVIVTFAGILITFSVKSSKKVALPESPHERIL